MKIRNDFVTNSSSVSFIITMDQEVAQRYNTLEQEAVSSKKNIIYEAVKNDLITQGSCNDLDGHKTYVKKYVIRPKFEASFEENYEGEEIDFANMNEEELWKYIKGEYILKMRMTKEYQGFSAMRLPKECPDVRSSIVFMSVCNAKFVKKIFYRNFDDKDKRIFDFLSKELEEQGELLEIEGKKVYAKVYTYDIKKDCMYDGNLEEGVPFTTLTEEELRTYIYGEYLHNKKLQNQLTCFSCLAVGEKKK